MYWNTIRALTLLVTANTVPWLLGRLLGARYAAPLDLGCVLSDGQRLFGSHKTWRGFISGVVATSIVGRSWGLAWWVGASFGVCALIGDALSSAIKRRAHRPPGTEMPMLDQLPEALLPQLILTRPLGVEPISIAVVTIVFILLDLLGTFVRKGTCIVAG